MFFLHNSRLVHALILGPVILVGLLILPLLTDSLGITSPTSSEAGVCFPRTHITPERHLWDLSCQSGYTLNRFSRDVGGRENTRWAECVSEMCKPTIPTVTETIPGVPTDGFSSCDPATHQASMSWSVPATAVYTNFTITDNETGYVWPVEAIYGTSKAIGGLYGGNYSWSVQACNSVGCSAFVPGPVFSCQAPPPPPSELVATCDRATAEVTFRWTAPAGYNTFYTRVSSGGVNLIPFWNENLVGTEQSFQGSFGTTYDVWVHTKRTSNGQWSNPISTTVSCLQEAALVSNLKLSCVSENIMRMTWDPTTVPVNSNGRKYYPRVRNLTELECSQVEAGDWRWIQNGTTGRGECSNNNYLSTSVDFPASENRQWGWVHAGDPYNPQAVQTTFSPYCKPTPRASGLNASCNRNTQEASFSWNTVTGATSYKLYLKEKTASSATTTYTNVSPGHRISGLNESRYSWWLQACNVLGVCSPANYEIERGPDINCIPDTVITPQIPLSVSASCPANTANITWPSVSGAASYNVRLQQNATGPYTILTDVVSGHSVTNLTSTIPYSYWVQACGSTGSCSAWRAGSPNQFTCAGNPGTEPQPATIIFDAKNKLIGNGDTAELFWNIQASYDMACTLRPSVNPLALFSHTANLATVRPVTDPFITQPLFSAQEFTLTCSSLSYPDQTKTIRVEVVPTFQST